MCPATTTMGLSDDERVVALDPAVRREDEEVQPDCEQLAVLGDRLPVELGDVAESFGVVAPAEAEPLGADPVLVRARHPSLYLLASSCLEDRRQPDPGLRRDPPDLLRRLEEMPPVLRPELRDRPPAPVGIGLVPERDISIRHLRCRIGPGLGVAHGGNDRPGTTAGRLPPMCSARVTVGRAPGGERRLCGRTRGGLRRAICPWAALEGGWSRPRVARNVRE